MAIIWNNRVVNWARKHKIMASFTAASVVGGAYLYSRFKDPIHESISLIKMLNEDSATSGPDVSSYQRNFDSNMRVCDAVIRSLSQNLMIVIDEQFNEERYRRMLQEKATIDTYKLLATDVISKFMTSLYAAAYINILIRCQMAIYSRYVRIDNQNEVQDESIILAYKDYLKTSNHLRTVGIEILAKIIRKVVSLKIEEFDWKQPYSADATAAFVSDIMKIVDIELKPKKLEIIFPTISSIQLPDSAQNRFNEMIGETIELFSIDSFNSVLALSLITLYEKCCFFFIESITEPIPFAKVIPIISRLHNLIYSQANDGTSPFLDSIGRHLTEIDSLCSIIYFPLE